ncbi:MAG: hypothetical protein F8N39_17440 [Clostridiaceae bacterium]|nr:hypothetical protein [Clostridiaceae bacterium]
MKKKKGSSLIMVMMVFAILTIMATSVLSLTLMSYKKRIVESSEKKNQYFSESGLDIAYGIIGKEVDDAVKAGNKQVKAALEEATKNNDSSLLKDDGTLDENAINNIFKQAYQQYLLKSVDENGNEISYDGTERIKFFIQNGLRDESNNSKHSYNVGGNSEPQVSVNNSNKMSFDSKGDLSIPLISTYKDNTGIEKKIAVNYSIKTPNYNEAYYVKRAKIPFNDVWKKAICADTSLQLSGDATVNGNIYVSAANENEGIQIQNGASKLNGVVATSGDFVINGEANVTGNVYSGNINLKSDEAKLDLLKDDSKKLEGAVYTNNDLEVNGEKCEVDIPGGFYGINDTPSKNVIEGSKKPSYSSSILINATDINKFNIQNDAIIMGTAYIKTNPQYQTGESVSIKGNYIAYTQPLKSDEAKQKGLNEDNVSFEYMDPLTLVNNFTNGTPLTVVDKAKYFVSYKNENSSSGLNLLNGKISLPVNAISAGATVSGDGNVQEGTVTAEENKLRTKRLIYAKRAFRMGEIDDNSIEYNADPNSEFQNQYKQVYQENQYKKTSITKVSDKVKFDAITTNPYNKEQNQNIIYLNGDSNKDCYVLGKGAVGGAGDAINMDSSGNSSGIIITSGNVYIKGEVNFKGTIISAKSIIFCDDGKKTINYDGAYVKKIIGDNYGYFNNIFQDNLPDDYASTSMDGNDNSVGTDIIRDKLITMKNWKIVK